MDKEKRIDYNKIYIAGEVLDKYDIAFINEDKPNERLKYKLDILTSKDPEMIVTVECFMGTKTNAGKDSAPYLSALSSYKNLKTRAEHGKGDMVNCTCKMSVDDFYYKGKLIKAPKIYLEWCNRESKDFKVTPGANWKAHVYITDIKETEDIHEVSGLINDYMSDRSIRGYQVVFKITDKEIADSFLEIYQKGDVVPLEGVFTVLKEEKDLSNMDLSELPVTGMGSVREKIIAENKRRKELRENGDFRYIKCFEITGGSEVLEDLEGTPFEENKRDEMLQLIENKINESMAKDIEKHGIIEDDDDDIPFK